MWVSLSRNLPLSQHVEHKVWWYSQLKIMWYCVGLTFWGTLRTPTMRMENLIRIHPLLSPLMFDMTNGQCRFHCGILWNWGNFPHSSKLPVSLWKQHRKYEKRCHKHMDFLQCGERALTGVIYCSIWTGSKWTLILFAGPRLVSLLFHLHGVLS